MPHAPRFLFGAVLLAAGLAGLAMWFHGDVSRNSGYGMFMLSIMGLLAGAHSLLSAMGINLFGRDGSSDSGTSLFDESGDGGDGD